MRETIRCCISCILPCGSLDVIRIVHVSGRVEEISGTVKAGEIMKLYPKHVLKKPSSSSDDTVYPRIVAVPPEAELRRGMIYFLMPLPQTPEKTRSKKKKKEAVKKGGDSETNNLLVSDRYLTEILSEKVSTQRDRRRGRTTVWRPHLESICETPVES